MEDPSSTMLRPSVNFGFAFNDANFSDRVLHMKIKDDSLDSNGNRKRKRQILDKENDSESHPIVKIKTYHISSPILAGNSLFFHKLFKNGMKESQQRDVTLTINESEEVSMMNLLNFMYNNTLKETTIPDLLGVLIAADKFEVTDCMRCCSELLQKMPMSLESALLYVELPSSVLVSEVVQPLINGAKEYLVAHYNNIDKFQEELMALPLSAVEVVLAGDFLQATSSGDEVFELILTWARANYPELNERREILTKRLAKFIGFRHMSQSKLKEVLVCPDFDQEEVTKLMLEALISVHKVPYWQHINVSNNCQVIEGPRCIVDFDLKKGVCENLFPSGEILSRSFILGGRTFYLVAQCCTMGQQKSFGLSLRIEKGSESCTLDYEYAVKKKSSMEFQQVVKDKDIFCSIKTPGWVFKNLFGTPWFDFISKESDYFIGGILHLRANLTISNAEA